MSEVEITEAEGTLSGGYIPWLKEKYPFSKLTNSTFTDKTKTTVKGPSFLIAKEDNPPSVLAKGRKRFKHCLYISRKVNKEGDVRVWLHPESALPSDKPSVGAKVAPKPELQLAKTAAPKSSIPVTPEAGSVVQKPAKEADKATT